jgi:hypothetical protein
MTAELPSLLWHALDAYPSDRAALARDLGKEDRPAKELIDADSAALDAAWRAVEQSVEMRATFQLAFARLDTDREPAPAHYALARLLHAGVVEFVVSFNWDTALERAYEHLFGTSIADRPDLLDKPHGNAATPDERWVLPHERGVVPEPTLARIADFAAQRPRALLLVGYSSSDEAVVEHLVGPAQSRWPVVEVGPQAAGKEALTGYAHEVLSGLADAFGAGDLVGWRWVAFDRQRDLRAALLGYRLGPHDVEACPAVPAVSAVAERLRHAGFAVISGESGAGKSITAFQAARSLSRSGWSVVELSQPGVATPELVRTFEGLRGPVLAVVDDAQALGAPLRRALERAVSADHAVLLVSTGREPGQEQVHVLASQTTTALVRYCVDRADVVGPLVKEIDDRVGNGGGREPYTWRLKAAGKSAQFPWQFMHVLSGGERRIAAAIAGLADANGADLLLGQLAADQLLSLDAGATRDGLGEAARLSGRDDEWVEAAMGELAGQRLVVARDDRLRTPHMRIADRALLVLCRDPASPSWRPLVAYLRSQLLNPDLPLQGKLWLLRAIDQADPLRFGTPQSLLDEEVATFLTTLSLAAPAGQDRNIASYLLWEVGWWRALTEPLAEAIAERLRGWLLEATADDVYGLAWLLGGLRTDFPTIHAAVSESVDPGIIGRRLSMQGTPESGEHWGWIVSELAHAEGIAHEAWATQFESGLDIQQVCRWTSSASEDALYGIAHLVEDLMFLAPATAASIIQAATPALSGRLAANPAAAAHDLWPWACSVFPLVATQSDDLWQANPAYAQLRAAVDELVRATDWEAAGNNLPSAELHELDQIDLLTYSLHSVAPLAVERMGNAIPLDRLDRVTEGRWRDLDGIVHLVVALGRGPDRQPGRRWVERHRQEIERVPTRIAAIAPEVAVEVLARGGRVELSVEDGLRWGWCAEALDAIVGVDRDAALEVVIASRDAVIEGLALRHANTVGDLPDFASALDRIDPALLTGLVGALDPGVVYETWSSRLSGSDDERAAALLLIERAREAGGAIGDAALTLRESHGDAARQADGSRSAD